MKNQKNILESMSRAAFAAGCACIVAMLVLTLINIALRACLGISLRYAAELSGCLCAAGAGLCLPLTQLRGGHIEAGLLESVPALRADADLRGLSWRCGQGAVRAWILCEGNRRTYRRAEHGLWRVHHSAGGGLSVTGRGAAGRAAAVFEGAFARKQIRGRRDEGSS